MANEVVADQARECGLTESQIICHGLPIRPAFSTVDVVNKQQLRQKLGLDPLASTVMLIGGGEGMGKLEVIAKALSERYFAVFRARMREQLIVFRLSPTDQLVIICGRNKTLADKLLQQQWNLKVCVKVQSHHISSAVANVMLGFCH